MNTPTKRRVQATPTRGACLSLALAALLSGACGAATGLFPGTQTESGGDAGADANDVTSRDARADSFVDGAGDEVASKDATGADDATSLDATGAEDSASAIVFASNASWQSYTQAASGGAASPLGPAQPVCVAPNDPLSCPPGAVVYTASGTGWPADLTSIPGAEWIWRADVNPNQQADFEVGVFQSTFVLGENPAGWIAIAADDYGEVHVNGSLVGSVGSVTDEASSVAGQSVLTTFDLSSFLAVGANVVTVVGENGPANYSCPTCGGFTYAQNPAGVVFGGELTSD